MRSQTFFQAIIPEILPAQWGSVQCSTGLYGFRFQRDPYPATSSVLTTEFKLSEGRFESEFVSFVTNALRTQRPNLRVTFLENNSKIVLTGQIMEAGGLANMLSKYKIMSKLDESLSGSVEEPPKATEKNRTAIFGCL